MKALIISILVLLLSLPVAGQSGRSYDLVVYGGTAGGVMTAVAAAREGLRVALVEPGTHLGGMVTGGLSRTDFGKREVLGGIAVEFYRRAGKKYGRDIEWMPEPRIAEQVLNEMIREARTVTARVMSAEPPSQTEARFLMTAPTSCSNWYRTNGANVYWIAAPARTVPGRSFTGTSMPGRMSGVKNGRTRSMSAS